MWSACRKQTYTEKSPAHARNYTHVVIDGPPRVNALARSAILAADRILIPRPALALRRVGGPARLWS